MRLCTAYCISLFIIELRVWCKCSVYLSRTGWPPPLPNSSLVNPRLPVILLKFFLSSIDQVCHAHNLALHRLGSLMLPNVLDLSSLFHYFSEAVDSCLAGFLGFTLFFVVIYIRIIKRKAYSVACSFSSWFVLRYAWAAMHACILQSIHAGNFRFWDSQLCQPWRSALG